MIGTPWLKRLAGGALILASAGFLGGCVVYDPYYDDRRYRGYEGRHQGHHHGHHGGPPRRGGYYR